MKRILFMAAMAIVVTIAGQGAQAGTVFLDADSPATGSLLETQSLLTPYGTIAFVGEIWDGTDTDLTAVGSVGNVFDIDDSDTALLAFDFDVTSATFIYGGNGGGILVEARDEFGGIVDSLYQASTGDGEPAGPVTLSGAGIRSLYWEDPGYSFAALDNITLATGPAVPVPGAFLLGGLGASLVTWLRRRRML